MTSRKTILYAEDTDYVRKIFTRCLSGNFPDNPLEIFQDGSSLERRLGGDLGNVGLVITDNEMPGRTGSQIIREYARREEFRRIPFVLLYAGDPLIGEVAVKNGAFAYAEKLSGMDNIITTIKRALGHTG